MGMGGAVCVGVGVGEMLCCGSWGSDIKKERKEGRKKERKIFGGWGKGGDMLWDGVICWVICWVIGWVVGCGSVNGSKKGGCQGKVVGTNAGGV